MTVAETTVYDANKYKSEGGNTECVAFITAVTAAPATTSWKKGKKVLDASEAEIKKGTAIATFDDNGKYPKDGKGKHAAIYLSHSRQQQTITVLDQWNSQGGVKKRIIHVWANKNETIGGKPYKRSNDADTFYVIE